MKAFKPNLSLLAVVTLLSLGMQHFAYGAETPAKDSMKTEQTNAAADMTDGEIRKVDT